jgi:hypothetical protein
MPRVFAILLLFCTSLSAVADQDPFWSFYDLLPGSSTWAGFFETYHPESTLLIEDSNGFAAMDRPRIYVDGWSPRALPWLLHGASFNSRLFSGAPLGFLPLAARTGFLVNSPGAGDLSTGVTMVPQAAGALSSVSVSTVSPNLGSYSPWAQFLISTPAIERADMLYETRRQFDRQVRLDGQWRLGWGDGKALNLAVTHQTVGRMFNDFGEWNRQVVENSEGTDFYGDYQFETSERSTRVWLMINRQDRDRDGAEMGMLPQETVSLNRMNWATGVNLRRWGWHLSAMLGYERDQTLPGELNFSKDLYDSDGVMIFSQVPFGNRSSYNFSGRIEPRPLKRTLLAPYADWRVHAYAADETSHEHNALTLNGRPYGVLIWDRPRTESQQNQLYHVAAGLQMNLPVSDRLLLSARAEVNQDGFFGSTLMDTASFTRLGLFGTLTWRWNDRSQISFDASRFAHPLNGDLVDFLDANRPGGSWYRWDDPDGNFRYDEAETGDLICRTGGGSHRLDDSFRQPMVSQIRLSLSFPMSQNWRFALNAGGKQVQDSWTVRYAEPYGTWKEFDGKMVYLLDQAPRQYIVTNLEADRTSPQYWHLMFRFIGQKAEKWYFSFSFMAHMGLGETPWGNGPVSNDYLALSEGSADPNGWYYNYGRLDGDRAFVAKLSYALYLSRRLTVGLSAKYRDGNPFAFLSADLIEDQLVMRHETLKAEDQKGNKLGPREDYVSEVNLRVNYRIPLLGGIGQIALEWHNLIDVGYELSEYVFNSSMRLPLELTIPRSLRLTLSWMDKP